MKKLVLIITTILITVTASITVSITNAFAVQEFEHVPGQKIRAKISANNPNRIEFGKIGIAQVIGDETKYKIVTDHKAQNIFLLPKLEGLDSLELALVSSSGEVADLVLKPDEDIEGQIIRISSNYNNKLSSTKVQEVTKMMTSMILDKKDKYYVTKVKRKISNGNMSRNATLEHGIAQLSIEQDRIYQFSKIIGARLVVTNKKGKTAVRLNEVDFSNLFDSCLAVTLEKPVLSPKAKGFVWIVTEVEKDN